MICQQTDRLMIYNYLALAIKQQGFKNRVKNLEIQGIQKPIFPIKNSNDVAAPANRVGYM
jgi:hypothetical protein